MTTFEMQSLIRCFDHRCVRRLVSETGLSTLVVALVRAGISRFCASKPEEYRFQLKQLLVTFIHWIQLVETKIVHSSILKALGTSSNLLSAEVIRSIALKNRSNHFICSVSLMIAIPASAQIFLRNCGRFLPSDSNSVMMR